MRSIQLEEIRDAADRQSSVPESIASQVTEALDRTRESRRGQQTRESSDGRTDQWTLDIVIGGLSLLLALVAWRRDRSKSRRELMDAAVFVTLGVLERYAVNR